MGTVSPEDVQRLLSRVASRPTARAGAVRADDRVIGWGGGEAEPFVVPYVLTTSEYVGASGRNELPEYPGIAGKMASFAVVVDCEFTRRDYVEGGESPILAYPFPPRADTGNASAADGNEDYRANKWDVFPGQMIPGPFKSLRFRRSTNVNTPTRDVIILVAYNIPVPAEVWGTHAVIRAFERELLAALADGTLALHDTYDTAGVPAEVALNGTNQVTLAAAATAGTNREIHLSGRIHATADVYAYTTGGGTIGTSAFLLAKAAAGGGQWDKVLRTNGVVYAKASAANTDLISVWILTRP